ncbi:MAG: hypothetical protein KGL39_57855 [Patescibacteria group bacterium]|nr:hypothetical protein [Patescibacteria group bacterium]
MTTKRILLAIVVASIALLLGACDNTTSQTVNISPSTTHQITQTPSAWTPTFQRAAIDYQRHRPHGINPQGWERGIVLAASETADQQNWDAVVQPAVGAPFLVDASWCVSDVNLLIQAGDYISVLYADVLGGGVDPAPCGNDINLITKRAVAP